MKENYSYVVGLLFSDLNSTTWYFSITRKISFYSPLMKITLEQKCEQCSASQVCCQCAEPTVFHYVIQRLHFKTWYVIVKSTKELLYCTSFTTIGQALNVKYESRFSGCILFMYKNWDPAHASVNLIQLSDTVT